MRNKKKMNDKNNIEKNKPKLLETLQILAHVVVNCLKRNG